MKGMILAYQDYTPHDASVRDRVSIAFKTWEASGARLFPYRGEMDSREIGDHRGCPFVADVIDAGFASGHEQILIISNNDIIFGEGLGDAIRQSCLNYHCYWAYRVPHLGGEPDGGLDLFAMTRGFWRMIRHHFPDLLLGYYYWDQIMAKLMKWSGCPEGARLYFHTAHPGIETRQQSPGQLYNIATAKKWLKENGEPE